MNSTTQFQRQTHHHEKHAHPSIRDTAHLSDRYRHLDCLLCLLCLQTVGCLTSDGCSDPAGQVSRKSLPAIPRSRKVPQQLSLIHRTHPPVSRKPSTYMSMTAHDVGGTSGTTSYCLIASGTQEKIDFTHAAVCLHERNSECASTRRKRCEKPFAKRWLAIYAASLVYEAVAGLFGVDACETSRHGQWLPSTSSEWRGKLPRPATRAKDQTKLHAPHDSAEMDCQPEQVISDISSGSIGRTEAANVMLF
jgi:hypothetical protein